MKRTLREILADAQKRHEAEPIFIFGIFIDVDGLAVNMPTSATADQFDSVIKVGSKNGYDVMVATNEGSGENYLFIGHFDGI